LRSLKVTLGGVCCTVSSKIKKMENKNFLVKGTSFTKNAKTTKCSFFFKETSTLLKNGGMHWSPKMCDQFQHAVVSIQVAREDQAIEWAKMIAQDSLKKKVIIIYDR
jgi:hypothetical protein